MGVESSAPPLLDLFCGAGGAAMGYYMAGFEDITGVDIVPQPHYPFKFVQADALEYLAAHGHEFGIIHASPPCQGYSIMHNLPWLRGRDYPLLILPTLEILEGVGSPYILENVMGARHGSKTLAKRGLLDHGLQAGWLCGAMFGLPFYRHRLFAANWLWLAPGHPRHKGKVTVGPSGQKKGRGISERIVARLRGDGDCDPNYREMHPNPVNTAWRETHDGGQPRRHAIYPDGTKQAVGRGALRNGAQVDGAGIGHSKGWRLAAEAMGIDWMNRGELTQAVPPAYTEFLGAEVLRLLHSGL